MRLLALVIFFVFVTSPMLWDLARAEQLAVVGCSKKTCEQIQEKAFGGRIGAIDNVSWVFDSHKCPGICTEVMAQGQHAHIIGNHLDIECKVWGGRYCKHSEAKK